MLLLQKNGVIVDCTLSSPKVKGKARSDQSIKKCHVETGFINDIDVCPNIDKVTKSSSISFSIMSSLKQLFLDNVRRCTSKIHFSSNSKSERTHYDIGFVTDDDYEGNQCQLTVKSVLFGMDQRMISDRSL